MSIEYLYAIAVQEDDGMKSILLTLFRTWLQSKELIGIKPASIGTEAFVDDGGIFKINFPTQF